MPAPAEEPGIKEKALELLKSDPLSLILNLHSPDHSLSSHALSIIRCLTKTHTNALCWRISSLILSTREDSNREIIVNFLRKLLTASGSHFWIILTIIHKNNVKRMLLECLEKETSKRIAKILCKLVSDIAVESEWPELVLFMVRSFEASDVRVQETSVFLFGLVWQTFREKMSSDTKTLHSLFLMCFSSESWRVRAEAVRALVRLIVSLTGTSSSDLLERLPLIIDKLGDAVANENDQYARKIVKNFVVLVREKPVFSRSQIDTCMVYMFKIAEKNEVWSEKSRHLAVQFLITLAEDRHQGHFMLQYFPENKARILSILFDMVADVRDDDSWYKAESHHQDSGETNNSSYGKESLRRFASAKHVDLTDKKFLNHLIENINDRKWQNRYAVPAALAQMTEGCSVEMPADLESFVQIASRFYKDSHPRVRWAAIYLLEQVSKYFYPQLHNQHHPIDFPSILAEALNDFQNPRIQAHAAMAITYFTQSCTIRILETHLDYLVSSLLKLLQNGSQFLKEKALIALGSLANSYQHFRKYYVVVMLQMKVTLKQVKTDHRLLAKAIDCIMSIWMVVGKEHCSKDSQEVVELLQSLQESQMKTDDPMRIFILESWGKLCKCLGKEFLPYMAAAMPHLLQSAAQLQNGEESLNAGTNQLKEKVTACRIICACAAELKEDFHLWIHQVAMILIPLLKFELQEVRVAAAEAMAVILNSTKLAVERGLFPKADYSTVLQLSDKIIRAMIESLHMETNWENCARILRSVNGCIQISGPYLTCDQAKFIMDEISKLLIAGSLRRGTREHRGVAQDYSDAGEIQFLNEVGYFLVPLINRFKQLCLPSFETILKYVARTWSSRTIYEQILAIYIFREVVKNCGEEALKYYERYLPLLLEACKADEPNLQKMAASAIGVCAEFGRSIFRTSFMDDALSCLERAISKRNAPKPDRIKMNDVSVTAIVKIYYYRHDNIQDAKVLSTWLGHLPIANELNEAKAAHHCLCGLIVKTAQEALSVCLPKIVYVFAEILWAGNNLATEQTVAQIISLLTHFKQTLPTAWASSWSSLAPQRQNFLQTKLSGT